MAKYLDDSLVGQTLGLWLILGPTETLYKYGRGYRKWQAQCTNCGILKVASTSNLHQAVKLGCAGCRNCAGMPKGQSGFNRLLDYYRGNCKAHRRKFLLSEDEARRLTSQPCNYCGIEPYKVATCNTYSAAKKSHWGDYTYNGIDRIDNALDYVPENCVPCCEICNRAKNSMSYAEFLEYINRFTRIK